MRVAMVSEHASPLARPGSHPDAGGQNVYVAELSTALARLGCDVTIHTRRTSPDAPHRVQVAPGVTVDHVPAGPPEHVFRDDLFPFMPEFAASLRREWRAEPPDVVHAHFWMSGWAAMQAAWPLGIPVVQTFHALGVVKRRHQGGKDTSPPERFDVEADLVRRVDKIVATCSDETFELLRLGADMERIAIVPCGAHLEWFTPDGPASARRDGMRRIVVVSRLVERKGIGNTIEALAMVPDCELVLAGGPPGEDVFADPEAMRLRELADRLGVADRVVFKGFVPQHDLPRLLRSADVAVCVPWYEPFGISAVEAMACGTPVVASCVGGLLDTVVDGITGLHVPPRDPGRLAEALNHLLDNPEALAAYGAAAARRVRNRYNWSRVAGSTLEVYRPLLGAVSRADAGR